MLRLIETGLATWRLSRALVYEDGPNDVFRHVRIGTGMEYDDEGYLRTWPPWNPLHCVFCTSLYAAVLVLLMPGWLRRALAASGVAVLVEELSTCLQEKAVGG